MKKFAEKTLETLTAVLAITLILAVSGFSPEKVKNPKVPIAICCNAR